MPARFPMLRPDGSFCVEVVLRTKSAHDDRLTYRLNIWLQNWVSSNRYWCFLNEQRDYFDEFYAAPAVISLKEREIRIRLQGKPSAKWWKDWLALRIIEELKAEFSEIGEVGAIENCSTSDCPEAR